ncbi:unnamed protein product [Caenorhabditis nigoni]
MNNMCVLCIQRLIIPERLLISTFVENSKQWKRKKKGGRINRNRHHQDEGSIHPENPSVLSLPIIPRKCILILWIPDPMDPRSYGS